MENWEQIRKEQWVAFWQGAPPPTQNRRDRNNFLMDTENWILRRWDSRQGIPKGPRRFENDAWATLVKTCLEDSDTCWDEYCAWVQAGYGDEWFQPEL